MVFRETINGYSCVFRLRVERDKSCDCNYQCFTTVFVTTPSGAVYVCRGFYPYFDDDMGAVIEAKNDLMFEALEFIEKLEVE